MVDDYDIRGANAALEEQIADKSVSIVVIPIDEHQARTLVEQKKSKAFKGMPEEEVKISRTKVDYIMYSWIVGQYRIRPDTR